MEYEYTYNKNNQLTSETFYFPNAPEERYTTNYTYDENGNQTGDYTYDARNRQVSYQDYNTSATYTYRPDGLRASKTVTTWNGIVTTTHFVWDGANMVYEYTSSPTNGTSYLYGIGLLARKTSAGSDYYAFNAHGDVTRVGEPDDYDRIYLYDAFGNIISYNSGDTNPFRYAGQYFDNETQTYYLRARYYNPRIGRFTTEDTHWNISNMIYGDNPVTVNGRNIPDIMSYTQSLNLYTYCAGNPVMYVDPTGNIGTPISWAMTVIVGVAGGFYGNYLADQLDLHGWKRGALIAGVAIGGAVVGFIAGEALIGLTTAFLVSNPTILMSLPTAVLSLFGINGDNFAVLARFAQGVGYTNLAQHIGACFYSLPNAIWEKLSLTERWAANTKFLDNMISQGKNFLFSNNAYDTLKNAPNSDFAKEIRYLLEKGYEIVQNGWQMIKK